MAPIRHVSHAFKTVPDSLSGGVHKIFTKVQLIRHLSGPVVRTILMLHIYALSSFTESSTLFCLNVLCFSNVIFMVHNYISSSAGTET